jgi:hypothetical protein
MKRLAMLLGLGLAAIGVLHAENAEDAVDATTRRVLLDVMVAPIHSKAELDSYLETHPDSPIHRLGASAMRSFLDSLVFARQGLGSYSYTELEGMSASDVYQILALFGLQSDTGSIRRKRSLSADDRMVEAQFRSSNPPRSPNRACWVTPNSPGGCHPDPGRRCSAICPR